jgi:acetyl esterase
MFWFQKQYTPRIEDQCAPEVSPCYRTSFNDLAPAFILTATYDPLLDDGYNYSQQLVAGGTMVRYQEYADLFHGFFNVPLVDPNAMKAYSDIQDFLSGCFMKQAGAEKYITAEERRRF